MTQEKRGFLSRFRLSGDRKYRWLLLLGLAGILLVGLSEWLSADTPHQPVATSASVSATALETALEERITTLLSQVQGVGDCRVMVTLEQGVRQVYATDSSGSGEQTVTVATESGPVGLRLAEIQPIVKGVAVVCAGGGDGAVNERVTSLIATVLNISSRRVCVTQMN